MFLQNILNSQWKLWPLEATSLATHFWLEPTEIPRHLGPKRLHTSMLGRIVPCSEHCRREKMNKKLWNVWPQAPIILQSKQLLNGTSISWGNSYSMSPVSFSMSLVFLIHVHSLRPGPRAASRKPSITLHLELLSSFLFLLSLLVNSSVLKLTAARRLPGQ